MHRTGNMVVRPMAPWLLLAGSLMAALLVSTEGFAKGKVSLRAPLATVPVSRGSSRSVACAVAGKDSSSRGGLRLLEWAGKGGFLPQPLLVKTAKTGWREAWKVLMSELAPQSKDGDYVRPSYGFRGKIGSAQHPATPGRYHLYTGNACPWCQRVLLVKAIRGISDKSLAHTVLIDDPTKASRGGWAFGDSPDRKDPVFGVRDLREVYEACNPGYSGRCTAPLMVDKETKTVVCNESEDLVRMLNEVELRDSLEFDVDLYPPALRSEIDEANEWIYRQLNNGVYRCGFATTQEGYDRAISDVTEVSPSQH